MASSHAPCAGRFSPSNSSILAGGRIGFPAGDGSPHNDLNRVVRARRSGPGAPQKHLIRAGRDRTRRLGFSIETARTGIGVDQGYEIGARHDRPDVGIPIRGNGRQRDLGRREAGTVYRGLRSKIKERRRLFNRRRSTSSVPVGVGIVIGLAGGAKRPDSLGNVFARGSNPAWAPDRTIADPLTVDHGRTAIAFADCLSVPGAGERRRPGADRGSRPDGFLSSTIRPRASEKHRSQASRS
jgi:hypothetical protein